MNVLDLVQQKREEILRLASLHGAKNVRIFGSVARGDERAESDIDFLIDVAPVHSSWFPAGLKLDLEEVLGRKVDVLTEASLNSLIRDSVLREAVQL